MLALLVGFAFGYLGSMPVAGPISVLVLHLGLAREGRRAFHLALGGALAEGIYALLAFWGLSAILAGHPLLLPVSRVLGAGILLGLGGAIFLIPALVLGFGVPMHAAVAAGLIAVIATSSAAGSHNAEQGFANVRLGMTLETATVLGALAGALLAHRLPERALVGLFALLQFAVSGLLWRRRLKNASPIPRASGGLLDGSYYDPSSRQTVTYSVHRLPAAMGVSVGAGIISTLLGVGGGIFKVPALHLFCGVPMKAAAATSNFMIGVTAATGAVVYLEAGRVPVLIAATVALGVLAGSRGGVWLSRLISETAVRKIFAVVTALIALTMFRRFLAS